MSKKSIQSKYLPAASPESISAAEEKIAAVKRANRKAGKRKIDFVMETVVRLIQSGKSNGSISRLVLALHKYAVSRDTVRRFRKSLPAEMQSICQKPYSNKTL